MQNFIELSAADRVTVLTEKKSAENNTVSLRDRTE